MVTIKQLINYLDEQLKPDEWKDYCPNGLQVAGSEEVNRLVTAVSASLDVIEKAIQSKAQAILVHHGYFWRGENPCIVGIKQQRLSLLLAHQINLIAYHLPLDGHAEWGNNVQLSQLLNFRITGEFGYQYGRPIALIGHLPLPTQGEELLNNIFAVLNQKPFYIPGKASTIKKIAWCTGAGQDLLEEAYMQGADAYLTGEISERTVHVARETGLHVFIAGHHATERYGVKALGEHLSQCFNLTHQYIEIDNPI